MKVHTACILYITKMRFIGLFYSAVYTVADVVDVDLPQPVDTMMQNAELHTAHLSVLTDMRNLISAVCVQNNIEHCTFVVDKQ